MKPRSEKVILTDADGVLLDWSYAFGEHMRKLGYKPVRTDEYCLSKCYDLPGDFIVSEIEKFNHSFNIRNIPPYLDAIKFVKKLHEEHGMVFHCITALSTDPDAYQLRKENLERLFGVTAFERIICVGTGAHKDEVLEEYRDSGCVWVEDKLENAELGHEMGLDSLLMVQDHTRDYDGHLKRVHSWHEIYEHVIGD